MNTRSLTITLGPDWRSALRKAGRAATAGSSHSNDMHFLKIFRKVVHVQ